MILAGEDLPPLHDVTEAHVLAIFDDSETGFGKFVVLSRDETHFIQAACLWEMNEDCEAFFQRTKSEPYCLEYRAGNNPVLRADGWLTFAEVRDAFLDYYRGGQDWKQTKRWMRMEY